jgi:tight adherence protein C
MDLTFIGFLLALFFVSLGVILAAASYKYFNTSEEQRRIQAFVQERHDTSQSRNPADLQNYQEYSEPLLQRTLVSWLNTIITLLGRYTPNKTIQETNRRLVIAGNPFNIRAPQYYGIRVLLLIIGSVISIIIYQANPSAKYLLLALLILLLFLTVPGVWLNAMMRRRQDMIRKGLPDALDLLSVITSAGLSFDQAMLRLGQTFKTPIGMEFSRVVSEIEIGISRKQALRNMQERVDISELSSFVSVILQSESLGMSIADVLHGQAEQMRIYRQFRAKEIAQKLPAKMMIPLVLFIFPALLAIILGPFFPVLQEILK